MAHSNKTDYLNLPQFAGNDHPTFQGDFNGAFLDIDEFASGVNNDLLELISSKNTLEALTNSLNESVNDLTTLSSTMSSTIQDLSSKYTITNNALNSLSNTVEGYSVDIQEATTTANSALDEAQSAFSLASSQGNRITSAENKADTATETANTAKTTAETAQSSANTAKTTANNAKTQADTNKTNIANLTTSVNTLTTTANTASTNASSALSKATTNETNIKNLQTTVNGIISATLAKFKEYALNAIFPVGSIYLSVSNTSPSTFLGGTWSKISSGRYLYTATSAGNTTGGSSTASFKLTERQTPWKQCGEEAKGYGLTTSTVQNAGGGYGFGDRVSVARNDTANQDNVTINLNPSYYTVIAWRRTA